MRGKPIDLYHSFLEDVNVSGGRSLQIDRLASTNLLDKRMSIDHPDYFVAQTAKNVYVPQVPDFCHVHIFSMSSLRDI
jgi:hypothetical protein